MSKINDESLASTTPVEVEDDFEDASVAANPETHDIGAMVAGVRATRLRVKIQPNGHLLERLQEMADEIADIPEGEEIPEDLAEEWVETKADFDHEDVYVVEGRTSDWVRNFESEAKAQGINPKRKGLSPDGVREEVKRLMHAQIAAQIVSPEGVAEADVAALFAHSEPEGDKLYRAVKQVNEQPVKMMMPDFSAVASRLNRRG